MVRLAAKTKIQNYGINKRSSTEMEIVDDRGISFVSLYCQSLTELGVHLKCHNGSIPLLCLDTNIKISLAHTTKGKVTMK